MAGPGWGIPWQVDLPPAELGGTPGTFRNGMKIRNARLAFLVAAAAAAGLLAVSGCAASIRVHAMV
jgi:hypothetical protein